jgi:hypothetical protein
MYRRVSLIDMRNTYPAKSRPAVPNMFRTTLNVFIVLPSKPIWRASSMPWHSKRFSPVDCELDGRDPNGYAGITWRQARPRLVRSAGLRENSIYVFCQHHENPIPRNTSTRSSRSAAFSQPKLSRHADKSFYTETVRLGISVLFTKLYSTLTNSLQNFPQAQPTFVVPTMWTAINWE